MKRLLKKKQYHPSAICISDVNKQPVIALLLDMCCGIDRILNLSLFSMNFCINMANIFPKRKFPWGLFVTACWKYG